MNLVLKTIIFWSLCQTLLLGATSAWADVNARLDRQIIVAGETVNLLIEAQGQITAQPDTEPLSKDFEVLGVSTGSRVNIINGQVDNLESGDSEPIPVRPGPLGIVASPFGPNIYVRRAEPKTPADSS